MAGPAIDATTHDLEIDGMTCASCANRIEKKLNKLDGVTASVNYATEKARVTGPADLDPQALIAEVEKTGYTAVLPAPPKGSTETPQDESETREDAELRSLRQRLIGAAVLAVPVIAMAMIPALQFDYWGFASLVLAAPVVVWAGWPFHKAAWMNLKHGTATMDTLISVGTTAALLWSIIALFFGTAGQPGVVHPFELTISRTDGLGHIYLEVAAGVITFILLGRYFEKRSKRRAGAALRALLELGAKDVAILRDGREQRVSIDELTVGDEFVVRPGEKIATDGFVVSGHSAIDTSLITGESVPVEVSEHDTVTGATINTSGRLVVKATRTGADTTLAQMGQLVSRAQSEKAPIARLADRISAVFVPIVLVIAVVTLIGWLIAGDPATAFRAAVTVLIIACPCALGLATPVGLLAGTGRASQMGILISGPQVLEDSRGVDTVVLDKTGTVTEGQMAVSDVSAFDGRSTDDVLVAAAAVELGSEHPIAAAIVAAGQAVTELPEVTEFSSTAGGGVVGTISLSTGKHRVAAGRSSFIIEHTGALTGAQDQALADAEAAGATAVWVAIDGQLAGIVSLQDQIKDTSAQAIAELKKMGITPMLLTGDNASVARQVAEAVGINPEHVFAGVRPEDKVEKVKELQAAGKTVAMAGDGVNDAPALAQADLGIAMGSGTDVAREAADITVMGSSLTQVTQALQLSRKTLQIIRTNLFWAFAYNTAGIPIAAFGLLNPMFAGAAMAASSVLVVLNSLRLTRFGR